MAPTSSSSTSTPRRATTPRKSTPRRARSSSVASNVSRSSSKPPSTRGKAAANKKDGRPALPTEKNPKLPADPVPVKLQIIRREERDIIIGRVKLDTVNGKDHGFLLKRFDTNAIAASSMFQLAFPYADGAAEAAEMAYLDRKFDTDRANGGMITKPRTPKRGRPKKNPAPEDEADTKVLPEGSTGVRLQGTWLPCEDAVEIAEEYGLLTYAQPLIDAKAVHLENGPQLVGADNVAVSTAAKGGESPSATTPRKRQRTAAKAEDSEADESTSTTASPKASRGRKSKAATKAAENGEGVIKSTTTKIAAAAGLTQKEIDEQIKKSKDLAKDVQAAAKKATTGSSSTSPSTRGRKRRASNERPTADLDHLADDSSVNFVSRQVRRGTRAVRRRPVVSAAGAMGAAAAAGVGALAWFAGGNVDVAQSLLQQGLTHLQGFFF